MPHHDTDREFRAYHARNLELALACHGRAVCLVGIGGMGSWTALFLASYGLHVLLIDPDPLDAPNLHRHAASAAYLDLPKATAMFRTLRERLPRVQIVGQLPFDVNSLSDNTLLTMFRHVYVVVAATGNPAIDRRLNELCRRAGRDLVVPHLWGANDQDFIGDVTVVPWRTWDRWGVGCFDCVQPPREGGTRTADAQPGILSDVIEVARSTAELALGLVHLDAAWGEEIREHLAAGRSRFFLLPGSPPDWLHAFTERRANCSVCPPRNRPRSIDDSARDFERVHGFRLGDRRMHDGTVIRASRPRRPGERRAGG